MPVEATERKTQFHKIRVRSIIVSVAPEAPVKRFAAKDLLSGVGSGGATAEEARSGIMKYYDQYPDKLPESKASVS